MEQRVCMSVPSPWVAWARRWNSVPKRRYKITYEDGTGRVFRNVGAKLPTKMEVFRNVGTKLPTKMDQCSETSVQNYLWRWNGQSFFETSAQNYLRRWTSIPKRWQKLPIKMEQFSETSVQNYLLRWNRKSFSKRRHKITYEDGTVFRNVCT